MIVSTSAAGFYMIESQMYFMNRILVGVRWHVEGVARTCGGLCDSSVGFGNVT